MPEADASDPRSALVEEVANWLRTAFDDYNAGFADITRRARRRFRQGDRAGMRADANARFDLYDESVREAISRLDLLMGQRLFSRSLWKDVRRSYSAKVEGCLDAELYKTFFNSVSRRLFKTRGVDSGIEFVALDIVPADRITHPVSRRTYGVSDSLEAVVLRSLQDSELGEVMADPAACARQLASRLAADFEARDGDAPVSIELLETVFYREGRAFLVGRALGRRVWLPCVIGLVSENGVVRADALMTTRREVSILFGFTHSYFLADLPTIGDAVVFLRTLLPDKPVAELYTALGRAKQGKTERYRDFFGYLARHGADRFMLADGEPGMVMVVFALPGYPMVFKVIRDRFAPPKKFGRRRVMDRYRLVFRHDRVGRLVDAQEFRDLSIPLSQFSDKLLGELRSECAGTIRVEQDQLVVRHCYIQRQIRPLNLYLTEASEAKAREVVLDYGRAIRELACSNLFAGDLLLKNFGVTRRERVIFYDYDELSLLSDCRIRDIPRARSDEMELTAETWYPVADGDVFPEQFPRFMGLRKDHLALLARHHGELFQVDWWRAIQERIRSGVGCDVPPYSQSARLAESSRNWGDREAGEQHDRVG